MQEGRYKERKVIRIKSRRTELQGSREEKMMKLREVRGNVGRKERRKERKVFLGVRFCGKHPRNKTNFARHSKLAINENFHIFVGTRGNTDAHTFPLCIITDKETSFQCRKSKRCRKIVLLLYTDVVL
jgi:hypothetical protein